VTRDVAKTANIPIDLSPVTRHSSLQFKALPPLALYMHIPWCVRKCPYCDFNSHEARAGISEERYVAALAADLEQALPKVWGRRVHSVFFGGGTPSLFSARGIDSILAAVRARLALAPDAEITLEANPGTVEAEKFAAFRALGVNRLSLGIQSFDARHLKALGRIHDDAEARRAVEIALVHFDNVNLDLMYGLPGQTAEEAGADVESALQYAPPHLSCYHLTLEPNTYFHRYPPALPGEDATADMQDAIEARLAAAGYEHYETSAFARPGARCAHNLNYWSFGDYLGIGAGAHGKLTFPDGITRQMRVKHPERYMESAERGAPVQEEHAVGADAVGFEFMMNALRLNDGFPVSWIQERAGLPVTALRRPLEEAESRGLIERDHERITPTRLGRRFLNDLLQIFLGSGEPRPNRDGAFV
jgi:putative oxygen-independent coproporphyrinogen III oxidase